MTNCDPYVINVDPQNNINVCEALYQMPSLHISLFPIDLVMSVSKSLTCSNYKYHNKVAVLLESIDLRSYVQCI